jgi:hypothetical protein
MPPTTEPLSRNFLDETIVWILADEKKRQAVRAHNSPRTRYGRSTACGCVRGENPLEWMVILLRFEGRE